MPTTTSEENKAIVRKLLKVPASFFSHQPEFTMEDFLALLHPQFIYQNKPQPACHGIEEFLENNKGYVAPGVHMTGSKIIIENIVAEGNLVMTERVDYWSNNENTVKSDMMGVFEIEDGRVKRWTDYCFGCGDSEWVDAKHMTDQWWKDYAPAKDCVEIIPGPIPSDAEIDVLLKARRIYSPGIPKKGHTGL